MPGLVDGHQHPLQGGAALLKCNLNYEQLEVAPMQAKIQACLDQSRALEPDGWLEVVNWFQEGMLPPGTVTNRAVLDALKTRAADFRQFIVRPYGARQFARLAARGPRRQDA